ncbi:hypothetical protein BD289DRAFT_112614 [Coniella lustricola]|uniref:Uncharacterized protein n=1 Tax=Coniella lustricola TaxID=2025994 RepID=A0A2T3AGA7_9PEZI|nr:hypothetical protein BD289DRAFT_112614 [Coniella lustricola]
MVIMNGFPGQPATDRPRALGWRALWSFYIQVTYRVATDQDTARGKHSRTSSVRQAPLNEGALSRSWERRATRLRVRVRADGALAREYLADIPGGRLGKYRACHCCWMLGCMHSIISAEQRTQWASWVVTKGDWLKSVFGGYDKLGEPRPKISKCRLGERAVESK